MSKTLASMLCRSLAVALAGAALIHVSAPADAKSSRQKAKKSQVAEPINRTPARVAQRNGGWDPFPGYPGFRDRSTINHPNGRLNGQELFDSINDRAGSAGE